MIVPHKHPSTQRSVSTDSRRGRFFCQWWGIILMSLVFLSGCSMLVKSAGNRLADNLADAIADHDDPATVTAGGPAYLLMMDAMVRGNPNDSRLLARASELYSTYANAFVRDVGRSRRLTARALDYALRAVCLKQPQDCSLRQVTFDQFNHRVDRLSLEDVPIYYNLAATWAGWIQARSSDFDAIAELARAETLMRRILILDEAHMQGGVHLYLGAMSILLPPSLGGKPEEARHHFERAVDLSDGRNLMVKVLYARLYARMLFDRPLHDRLLHEVITADPQRPGFVLVNTMAQRQARQLLKSAEDYF